MKNCDASAGVRCRSRGRDLGSAILGQEWDMRCFITSGLSPRSCRVRAISVQPESLERRWLFSAYTVVDLGTLPGGSFSSATAVNDAGMVVGSADAAGP